MADFDPSSLPDIPSVQLQEPQLTVPGYQPPPLNIVPPFSTGAAPDWSATGGGSPAAMSDAFGHLADPPLGVGTPGSPNIFAPIPPPIAPSPMQLNGLGPVSGAVNPWLANPMGVAGDAQRQIDLGGQVDPGVAAQQHILHAPAISF